MNSGSDCAHGRQVGKCDTCDLIDAEQRILELEAKVKQLREPAQEAANVLGFLSFHLIGRIGEAALMDIAEKADALQGALDATPAQCLAETKAHAGRDGYQAS